MAKEDFERLGQTGEARRKALQTVGEQFNVSASVRHLQSMMTEVTKEKVDAQTVQAACSCANQINASIKTAILAAKYLSER